MSEDDSISEEEPVYGGPDIFSPIWNQQLPQPNNEAEEPPPALMDAFEEEDFDDGPTFVEQVTELVKETLSDPYKVFIVGGIAIICLLLVAVLNLI